MEGTWTKLRSGEWGVKVNGISRQLRKGDVIEVTVMRRDGGSSTERVKLIWTDEFGSKGLGAVVRSSQRSRRRYDDDGYAPDCGGRMCGECFRCLEMI